LNREIGINGSLDLCLDCDVFSSLFLTLDLDVDTPGSKKIKGMIKTIELVIAMYIHKGQSASLPSIKG